MKTNNDNNPKKTNQKTKSDGTTLCPSMYQKQRNYLDNSCEFIIVPHPGPVRASRFLKQLLQPSIFNKNPILWSTPHQNYKPGAKIADIFDNQRQNNNGNLSGPKEPVLSPKEAKEEEDLEEEVSVDEPEDVDYVDDRKFLGKVNFYNENDSVCEHNIFLKYHQKQDKSMEITRLENNSLLIKFVQPKKDDKDVIQILDPNSPSVAQELIFIFFQTVKNFKRNGSLINKLKKKLFGEKELTLRYFKIKNFLTQFFSMEPFENELAELNQFEILFVGVVLHKKKYQNWDLRKVDFAELQKSRSKQQRMRLLEMFVVHLLQHMADLHTPESSLSRQRKVEALFEDLFGKERESPLENIKSVRARIQEIRHKKMSSLDALDQKGYSREELLRNLILSFFDHVGFKKMVNRKFLERLTQQIFEKYKEKKIGKIVGRIVDSFESKVEHGMAKMESFLKYCVDLKANSKFKCVWTRMEFVQGMEFLVELAGI